MSNESILISTKKKLGLDESYNAFDMDIIIDINSVFSILNQMGVGPDDPFTIDDDSAMWSDFLEDVKTIEMVKTYMYLRVRLMFDPPNNSFVTDSFNKQIQEFEWRMYCDYENRRYDEES